MVSRSRKLVGLPPHTPARTSPGPEDRPLAPLPSGDSISGFSFIEVVLGIVILAALATPILMNQYQLIGRVMPLSSQLETLFSLESFWREQNLAGGKETKKTTEKLGAKYSYEFKPTEKSSLKSFKDIQIVRLQADWEFGGLPQQEILITFSYKPTGT